jgi:hypothetical protein
LLLEITDRGRDTYYYAPPAQSRYVWLSRIRLPPRVFDGRTLKGQDIEGTK